MNNNDIDNFIKSIKFLTVLGNIKMHAFVLFIWHCILHLAVSTHFVIHWSISKLFEYLVDHYLDIKHNYKCSIIIMYIFNFRSVHVCLHYWRQSRQVVWQLYIICQLVYIVYFLSINCFYHLLLLTVIGMNIFIVFFHLFLSWLYIMMLFFIWKSPQCLGVSLKCEIFLENFIPSTTEVE